MQRSPCRRRFAAAGRAQDAAKLSDRGNSYERIFSNLTGYSERVLGGFSSLLKKRRFGELFAFAFELGWQFERLGVGFTGFCRLLHCFGRTPAYATSHCGIRIRL